MKPISELYEKYATFECPNCIDVLIPTMPRGTQNENNIIQQLRTFRTINSYLMYKNITYRLRAKFVNIRPFNNPEFYWMRQFYHHEAVFLDAYGKIIFKVSEETVRPFKRLFRPRYSLCSTYI